MLSVVPQPEEQAEEVAEEEEVVYDAPLPLDVVNKQAILEMMAKQADILVSPILASRGVSVLSGPTGEGKSLLSIDLACTIAMGLDAWHGKPVYRPCKRRVLYVDAENSAAIVLPRVLAWAKHHGFEKELLEGGWLTEAFLSCTVPRAKLGSEDDAIAPAVLATIEQHEIDAIDLVVLDTLAALSGSDDANDNSKSELLMRDAQNIYDHAGSPVLMVCHPSKQGVPTLTTEMRQGRNPGTQQLVSGAQRVVDRAQMACGMIADGKDDRVRLLGQAKNRVGKREEKVLKWEITTVDIDVPEYKADDGEVVEAHTRSEPVVSKEHFVVVEKKANDKLGEFLEWLAASDHDSNNPCTYACLKDEDAPISENTLRKYLNDEKKEVVLNQVGFVLREVPNLKKKGGRKLAQFWIESGDE